MFFNHTKCYQQFLERLFKPESGVLQPRGRKPGDKLATITTKFKTLYSVFSLLVNNF